MGVLADVSDSAALTTIMKSAVAAGTTSDADWAYDLVDYGRLSQEFVSRLRPATIVGRLRGLRYTPPITRTLSEASGVSAGWVGEGMSSPIGKLDLDEVTLLTSKMQATCVVTSELVRISHPAALASLERLMVKSLAEALDKAFIDPTIALSAAGPASVTNGATARPMTGNSAANVLTDLQLMLNQLITAGSDLSSASFVLHPRTALYLSTLLNAGNVYAFPSISAVGGTLLGLPAITSSAMPVDTGNDTYVVLLDASRILIGDDDMVAVDVSRQSSLQLLSNPGTGGQTLVSLWQNGMVGLRLTRWLTWRVVDTGAICVLEDVSY